MNRQRWKLVVALMWIAATPLLAQRDVTGTHWTKWKPDRRMGYLIGYYAGLKADQAVFLGAERGRNLRKPGMTDAMVQARYKLERKEYYSRNIKYDFKLLARMIDALYSDEDNLGIPLPEAIRILRLRDDGNTDRADFLLLRERRKALDGN